MSEKSFDPPEPCTACEHYYAYMDGLCYECWYAAQEERAIEKYEERKCDEQ